jgi:hypothetical protein
VANDLQPPRGTHDLIGEDQRRHTHVVVTARCIAATYGFDEWSTPIFEDSRVFSRTLGETSDVVTKEMYTFTDRGGDSISLRPEATVAVCRKGFIKHFRPLFSVPCGLKSLQIRGLECDAWAGDRFPPLPSWISVSTWALCMARVVGGARMAGICSPGTPCMARLRCSMLAASTAA